MRNGTLSPTESTSWEPVYGNYKTSDQYCPHCTSGCNSCGYGKDKTCNCCEVSK